MNFDDMRANAQALAEHVKQSSPPELGTIIVFVDRRTGNVVFAAPGFKSHQAVAVFKALMESAGSPVIMHGGIN